MSKRINDVAIRTRARELEWHDWETAPAKSLAREIADLDYEASVRPLYDELGSAITGRCDRESILMLCAAIAAKTHAGIPRRRRRRLRLVKGSANQSSKAPCELP